MGKEASGWTTENIPNVADDEGKPHFRPLYLYAYAKDKYYQGKPIMSDAAFDKLESHIKQEFPDCPLLEIVGNTTNEDAENLRDWICKKRGLRDGGS